jgi:hypothetical protein
MVVWGGRTGERTAGALPARDVGGSGGGRPILCSVEVDRRAEGPRHCTLPEENERDGSVTKRITCTAARSLFGLQPHNTGSRQEDGHHLHMIDLGRENHSERHNRIWKRGRRKNENETLAVAIAKLKNAIVPNRHQRRQKHLTNAQRKRLPIRARSILTRRRRVQRLLRRQRRVPIGGGARGRA